MILVVAGDESVADAVGDRRVEQTASVDAAADALSERSADVVAFRGDERTAARLVSRLRDGAFGDPRVPVVVAAPLDADDLPLLAFDRTPPPADPGALREALADALAVADYQLAVARLYEECQSRAEQGITDPHEESAALREVRAEADDRLDDLLADPQVAADLLWTPDAGNNF